MLLAGGSTDLLLTILLIFGGAKILSEVFERLGMPGVVGEIVAGVILGPSLLSWIKPNEMLETAAEIAVMFLLFQVGLEVKPSELVRLGGIALVVAVLGVVLPFLFGWGIMSLYGEPQIEAVFVGTALVATSVGITANVLAAKGWIQLQASRIIMAAAVIDDVLGLLVLAVVSGAAKGGVQLLDVGLTTLISLGFVFVIVKWGSRAAQRVVPRVEKAMHAQDADFSLAVVMLFALSLLAVKAGVAAIVGAFLAGMALSETVGHRVHEMARGAKELLVPAFLVNIGVQADVHAFRDLELLGMTLLITLAAVVSKLVGCGAGAWKLGRVDALRIGVGMVPRGEVGMIVAQIGMSLGVVSGKIYVVVVGMAILTTVIAPPLLAAAYRGADTK
jgi:Kef-type K+ transport system membrane component KefB